jgi:hypothetical protein
MVILNAAGDLLGWNQEAQLTKGLSESKLNFMNYAHQNSTAHGAAGGGFLVFGICALYGLRLLIRGISGDILDDFGTPVAGRSWFIVGGILLMLPLVAFGLFAWRQGYFRN